MCWMGDKGVDDILPPSHTHTHTHTSLLLVGAETVGDVSQGIVHHQTLHFPAAQPSHSLRLHHHTDRFAVSHTHPDNKAILIIQAQKSGSLNHQ